MSDETTRDPAGPDGPKPVPAPLEVREDDVRLLEAMIFASSDPVSLRAMTLLLPDGTDAEATLAALRERYVGRGVHLVDVAGGWQFRTAPDLAPMLRRVVQVPRRLPRVAMETLAIVAYHQPVTRPEIEEIRGASLAQATLDALLENGLIEPRGRRETPGRPTLWGTTAAFLSQFGLSSLRDLPRREDLLVEPPSVLPPEAYRTEAAFSEPAAAETQTSADPDGVAGPDTAAGSDGPAA